MAASISLAGLPSRFRKLQADFASLESTPPSVVAVCFEWPINSDPGYGVFRPEWVSFVRDADCVAGSWIRWATWRDGHWIRANRKIMLFGDHRPANKLQKLFAAAWDLIRAGQGTLPLPIKIPPADAPPEDCFLSLCFDLAAAQKLPSPVRLKGDAIFTRIRENMTLKLPAQRVFSPPTAQEIRDLAGEYQCLDGMPADHVVPWWAILDDVAATAAQLCYDIAELLEGGTTPTDARKATPPKRRGRKKADFKTVQKEAAIAEEWAQARDAGISKAEFAKDKGMTEDELNALLDRVRKRKSPLE